MTPAEILDRELDIIDRYEINQDFKNLIITYVDGGQKYTVHCDDEDGVRNLAGFLVQVLIAEEEKLQWNMKN